MPYYLSKKVSANRNLDQLVPLLQAKNVPYSDLYTEFKNKSEILYLKRDSHWNNKGAVLAYNRILTDLGKAHENFEIVPSLREKTYYGDLSLMLYPKFAEPEFNISYQNQQTWRYTEGSEVTDYSISTENDQGEGVLLMYRDSFGNTLLPLMADTYKTAHFENSRPYFIGSDVLQYKPDTIIIERVERNIREFVNYPPILTVELAGLAIADAPDDSKAGISIRENEDDYEYFTISGKIDASCLENDSDILLSVDDGEIRTAYEAYGIGQNKYAAYIRSENLQADEVTVTVAVRNQNGQITPVSTKKLNIGEFREEGEEK